jgi:hypothetical protein
VLADVRECNRKDQENIGEERNDIVVAVRIWVYTLGKPARSVSKGSESDILIMSPKKKV